MATLDEFNKTLPESPSPSFARLLNMLWDDSNLWWGYTSWKEFLNWANDQYGSNSIYTDPSWGMLALDEALEEITPGATDDLTKYQYFTKHLETNWSAAGTEGQLYADGYVKDLVGFPGFEAYDPTYEYVRISEGEYKYRRPGTADWLDEPAIVPQQPALKRRYTGIADYGNWFYALDTEVNDWRYTPKEDGETSESETLHRTGRKWLDEAAYEAETTTAPAAATTAPQPQSQPQIDLTAPGAAQQAEEHIIRAAQAIVTIASATGTAEGMSVQEMSARAMDILREEAAALDGGRSAAPAS